MTNSLVDDNQVAVVHVVEGVLEGSDMSGTRLNDSLGKIRHWMTNSLVGDHQVAVVNVDEGVLEGSDMSGT